MIMKKFWLSLFLLTAIPCLAKLEISSGKWSLSPNMKANTNLAVRLREIELATLNDALVLTEALKKEAIVEDVYMDDGEYLPLVLDSLALSLEERIAFPEVKIANKAEKLLEQYKKISEGKNFLAYKQLYLRQIRGYKRNEDYKKMIEAQKALVLYDPFDFASRMALQDSARDYPSEMGDMDDFQKKYVEAGGVIDGAMELAFILTGSGELKTKLKKGCEWIHKNRFASQELLLTALPRLTALVVPEDKEGALEYYKALSNLALQQPLEEERMITFAAAMDERKKLLSLVPSLLD